MKLKKLLISTLLLSLSYTQANAQERYEIPLSLGNNLSKSQDLGSDWAIAAIEGWRKAENQLAINDHVINMVIRPLIGFQIALWHHEIVGHTVRGNQVGLKTKKYSMDGFFSAATTYKEYDKSKVSTQQETLASLAGNEANHVLAEKIKTRIIKNSIDPIYATTYIFTQGNQGYYVYMSDTKKDGHDLKSYESDMQNLYGTGYVTMSKIKQNGILDLLDPMLYYSMYSIATNSSFEVPMIGNEQFKFLPATRMRLTPYGIEKQAIIYAKINDIAFKIDGGFGKTKLLSSSVDKYNAIAKPTTINSYRDLSAVTKNVNTYFGAVESDEFIQVDKLSLGGMVAFWHQPDVFAKNGKIDPILAKVKNGGMGLISAKYKLSDTTSVGIKGGYKTEGYIPGYPIKKGVQAKVTLFINL